MRYLYILLLTAILYIPAYKLAAKGGQGPFTLNPKATYDAGKAVVKINSAEQLDKLNGELQRIGAAPARRVYPHHKSLSTKELSAGFVDLTTIYEVAYSPTLKLEYVINRLRALPYVRYAEPRYLRRHAFTTNDPDRGQQTHLAQIHLPEAWDLWQGDTATWIGVVDSGVDWTHPDQIANIGYNWADPIDGTDNDGDGFTDNFRGWDLAGADYNAISQDNDPAPTATNNLHGGHVAGIASASTNNGIGGAGVAFKCRILPVKCAADNDTRGPGGEGYILNGEEGIVYAADHRCTVINCSWGGEGLSDYENETINYATINRNALVVCAAGNSASQNDFFPAYYHHVLSVAAVDDQDIAANFTNYSPRVLIAAPGVQIYSNLFPHQYGLLSGTSMASPVTAGVAALVRSRYPDLTPEQTIAQIRATSDDIYQIGGNSGYVGKLGAGRVNAYRALASRPPGISYRALDLRTSRGSRSFHNGDTIEVRAYFKNTLAASTPAFAVSLGSDNTNVEVLATNNPVAIGVVQPADSVANTATPFKVVLHTTGPDEELVFSFGYTDAGYNAQEFFSFPVNTTYVNFIRNNIGSTVGSNMRLGYTGSHEKGLGFQYKDWGNVAYEVGAIWAAMPTKVSDAVRSSSNGGQDDHFRLLDTAHVVAGDPAADLVIRGTANDAGNPGVAARLKGFARYAAYAWNGAPDTNYYIYEYWLKNQSNAAWATLYTGLYADLDVSYGGVDDRARYDASRKLAYQYDTTSFGLWAGIAVLGPANPNIYTFLNQRAPTDGRISITDGFTLAEKYRALSSGTRYHNAPDSLDAAADVSIAVGSGPYNVLVGDSVRVGFVVVVGQNLQSLQTAVDQANIRYAQIVTGTAPALAAKGVRLMPNPATTQIRLTGTSGQTYITVYGADGRLVKAQQVVGTQAISVADLPPGVYQARIQTGTGVTTERFVKE